MTAARTLFWLVLVLVPQACVNSAVRSSASGSQETTEPAAARKMTSASSVRTSEVPDDCAEVPGKPPPEPLRVSYLGVAKSARCQREVFTIMGGVTHFLGVKCNYCHLEPDYARDTHNKQIANWMARELVPRLRKRTASASGSRDVWCKDCHAGRPKPLGDPRRRDFEIEWMTTHFADDFEAASGKPPRCKDCHGGDLGTPEFRAKIVLTELEGER